MKKVLITGCSSGFGRLMVTAFLDDGWTVIATMRNTDSRSEAMLSAFPDVGSRLVIRELDITNARHRAGIAHEFADDLTVLINNAGFAQMGALEDLTDAQIDTAFQVNALGPLQLTRVLLPGLRAHRGIVINVSSMMAFMGFPLSTAYCASKAALTMASECLQHEMLPHGVSVVAVEPGGFRTRFTDNTQWGSDSEVYRRQTEGYRAVMAKLSRGQGTSPTPVIRRVLSLANRRPLTVRHPVGPAAVFTSILLRLLPEFMRQWFLRLVYRPIFR